LFGATLGFINGYAVVRSGVHSFIITLASMSIFFGVMIFLTQRRGLQRPAARSVHRHGQDALLRHGVVLLLMTLSSPALPRERVLSLHHFGAADAGRGRQPARR
jgi:ribose transport system permease protein